MNMSVFLNLTPISVNFLYDCLVCPYIIGLKERITKVIPKKEAK